GFAVGAGVNSPQRHRDRRDKRRENQAGEMGQDSLLPRVARGASGERGGRMPPRMGSWQPGRLLYTEGVEGVGFGAAAGGARHGQDGRGGGGGGGGGPGGGGGGAGIQAGGCATHFLAQGGGLRDGEPQADEQAAHHGAAATDEDLAADIEAAGAEREAGAQVARAPGG